MTKVCHGHHFLNPTMLVFNTETWLMTTWAEMLFLVSNPALLRSFGPCLFMKPSCVIPCFSNCPCPHSTHYTTNSFTVLLGLACLDCELFGNDSNTWQPRESRLRKHSSYLLTGFSVEGWQLRPSLPLIPSHGARYGFYLSSPKLCSHSLGGGCYVDKCKWNNHFMELILLTGMKADKNS